MTLNPMASVQLIVFGERGQNDFEGVLQDVQEAKPQVFPAMLY